MKKIFFAVLLLAPFIMSSCNKSHDDNNSEGLTGQWKRTESYANEYWGAPFSWRGAEDGTGVTFTRDGKYYRNEAKAGPALIGTYKIRSNHRIEIIATNASSPTQSFGYDIDDVTNELILTYDITEGTTREKFKRR